MALFFGIVFLNDAYAAQSNNFSISPPKSYVSNPPCVMASIGGTDASVTPVGECMVYEVVP